MAKPWYEQGMHQQRYWSYDAVHDFLYYALSEVDKLCSEHNIHYYLAYGSVLGAVRDGGIIPWDPDADIYVPAQELKAFIKLAREHFPDDLYVDFYDTNPSYNYTSPKIGKKGFTTNGLHLDVFPLVGIPEGKLGQRLLRKYEWQRIWFGIIQGNWNSRIPEIERVCQNKLFRRSASLLRKTLNKERVITKMEQLATLHSIFDCDNSVYDGFRVFSATFFSAGKEVRFGGQNNRIPSDDNAYLKQCYGDYKCYPDDRCFQGIIRSDYACNDITHQRVAYFSDFSELTTDQCNVLEKLYWESGSIVAVLDVRGKSEDEIRQTTCIAKSIKYFDKVLIADTDEARKKCEEMINPDYTVSV